jgi:glycerol-3-phosphate dehydrogenase
MDERLTFGLQNRPKFLQQLKEEEYDVLVIGGGVTGAGIALDAAARNMKVCLVEKDDFASGTSGKSTKLIHGGLRYLKQFEFGLVKEVGKERAILNKLAPHLVVPEKMLLPLIKADHWVKP